MITTNFFNTLCEYARAIHDTFVDGVVYPSTPSLTITADDVAVGATVTATVETTSDGAKTFTSSDAEKATVDASGVITGVAAGEVTITVATAETEKCKAASASVTINVTE